MEGYNYTINQLVTGLWYDDRGQLMNLTRCPVMDVSNQFIGDVVTFYGLIKEKTIHLSISDYQSLPNQTLEIVEFIDYMKRESDGN